MRLGISFENPGFNTGDGEVKSCGSATIMSRQVIILKKKKMSKDGVKVVTINPPAAL